MGEPIVDAVRARLAETAPQGSNGDTKQAMMPYELRTIEVPDLNMIADRHYRVGHADGYRDGLKQSSRIEREIQQIEDVRVTVACLSAIEEKLSRIAPMLAAPAHGRDRRTKDELREQALTLVDNARAALSVLSVQVQAGELHG